MKKKLFIALIAAVLTFGCVHTLSIKWPQMKFINRGILKVLFQLREPKVNSTVANPYVSDEAILMAFDIRSIGAIGKWPWKRHVHAQFLRNIERFSPKTVHFDIIFAKREEIPPYALDQLEDDTNALQRVYAAYDEMDTSFARELARYNNVILDLQLIEEPRDEEDEAFYQRLEANLNVLKSHSLPVKGENYTPYQAWSMEPILDIYVSNCSPAVINAAKDDIDGIMWNYPLYQTLYLNDQEAINVHSIVLQVLKAYLHVPNGNIEQFEDRVVLKQARRPQLDPVTRRPIKSSITMDELQANLQSTNVPPDYAYNTDFKNYLINRIALGVKTPDLAPAEPVRIARHADGSIELLEGWEVFHAARTLGSTKVDAYICSVEDVTIKAPVYSGNEDYDKEHITGSFNINYSGKDLIATEGQLGLQRHIKHESYLDVYALPELPPLPLLDANRALRGTADLAAIDNWFFEHCETKALAVQRDAVNALGEEVQDESKLLAYMNENPTEGRYFFYFLFLQNAGVEPGQFDEALPEYPFFAGDVGQDQEHVLTRAVILEELMDAYRDGFDRYYNKLIFAGGTALGIVEADQHQTPYANMAGISLIINAVNTILTDNVFQWSNEIKGLNVITLLALCLIAALLYEFAPFRIAPIIFVLSLFATYVVVSTVFVRQNLYITTAPLVLANVGLFLGLTVFKLFTEEKNKKFLQATFGTYLSPELIDEMVEQKTAPQLGGQAIVGTAFFTDIQGFSTFSEKLAATQLVDLLNEYLSVMTDILIVERGTLDKYIGDAIVAIFGAPAPTPDHALRACRVAVLMQEALDELRERWSQERTAPGEADRNRKALPESEWAPGDAWPKIVHEMRTRIGVNTGDMVVGNMGSTTRMNYTMMGDTVNLSARLEAGAKQFGVYNLISEYTMNATWTDEAGVERKVSEEIEARFIDRITVVGKTEPVAIYELCAMKGDLTEKEEKLFDVFNRGIAHYQATRWNEAIEAFEEALLIERVPDGKTTPSQVMLDRSRQFKEHPPVPAGETWDGVYRMTKK